MLSIAVPFFLFLACGGDPPPAIYGCTYTIELEELWSFPASEELVDRESFEMAGISYLAIGVRPDETINVGRFTLHDAAREMSRDGWIDFFPQEELSSLEFPLPVDKLGVGTLGDLSLRQTEIIAAVQVTFASSTEMLIEYPMEGALVSGSFRVGTCDGL